MKQVQSGNLPLSKIELGERRREDYGDIDKLAEGIRRVGLLHPLIVQRVNEHFKIVVGGRRLKALQQLKAESAPVRLYETLSEEELRDIELEENENRKDLTAHERRRTFRASKQVIADAKRATTIMADSATISTKPKRGPKAHDGVKKTDVANALGISRTTLREAEQHVETAERYPFMQGDVWQQFHVLEARQLLERLPEHERPQVGTIFETVKGPIHPKHSLELLRNFVCLPTKKRNEIYALAISTDSRDRNLAFTRALDRPPMPDPRIAKLKVAIDELASSVKLFPHDPLAKRISAAAKDVVTIRDLIIQQKEKHVRIDSTVQ